MGETSFQRVAKMNEAFGNPKGNAADIQWEKIVSQCKNTFDEYLELLEAMGLDSESVSCVRAAHHVSVKSQYFKSKPDVEAVRDALCDIQVFAQGAQHLMGYNGDNDMHDVVDGVMSRFVKNAEDKLRTHEMHHAKGVTEVYWEGEYPYVVMKSAKDQPDAPKGKVLKSASYKQTVFREAP